MTNRTRELRKNPVSRADIRSADRRRKFPSGSIQFFFFFFFFFSPGRENRSASRPRPGTSRGWPEFFALIRRSSFATLSRSTSFHLLFSACSNTCSNTCIDPANDGCKLSRKLHSPFRGIRSVIGARDEQKKVRARRARGMQDRRGRWLRERVTSFKTDQDEWPVVDSYYRLDARE